MPPIAKSQLFSQIPQSPRLWMKPQLLSTKSMAKWHLKLRQIRSPAMAPSWASRSLVFYLWVFLGLLHGSSHRSKGTASKRSATPTTSHQHQGSITNRRTINLMPTNSGIENKRDNSMTASPRSAAWTVRLLNRTEACIRKEPEQKTAPQITRAALTPMERPKRQASKAPPRNRIQCNRSSKPQWRISILSITELLLIASEKVKLDPPNRFWVQRLLVWRIRWTTHKLMTNKYRIDVEISIICLGRKITLHQGITLIRKVAPILDMSTKETWLWNQNLILMPRLTNTWPNMELHTTPSTPIERIHSTSPTEGCSKVQSSELRWPTAQISNQEV